MLQRRELAKNKITIEGENYVNLLSKKTEQMHKTLIDIVLKSTLQKYKHRTAYRSG